MSKAPDLDLHPYFRDPDKARAILDIAIADNVAKGRGLVRVVHGKGKGNFRGLIHKYLEKHPEVEGFMLCDPLHGGSGATWVHLRAKPIADEIGKEPTHERPEQGKYVRFAVYAAIFVLMLYLHAGLIYLGSAMIGVACIEGYVAWKSLR